MCIGAIAGCLGSACVGCCCASLKDCRAKHGPASRIPYMFILFVFCIYAVVMTLYGDTQIYENDLLDIDLVICDPDDNEACQANGTVYRTSFVLFVFFIIHTIFVCAFAPFHWLFFIIKFFCLIAVLVVTYFIGNGFFDYYSDFARIASGFFLLLQVLVLITYAYDINDRVLRKMGEFSESLEEDGSDKMHKAGLCCLQFGLIFATLIIYICIIVAIILFYGWFVPSDGCGGPTGTFIAITIMLVIIATALPILMNVPDASIFVGAIVSFYMSYLCYAALENYPDSTCNTFASNDGDLTSMWVGIAITAVAISYTGFSVSRGSMKLDDSGTEINMELEAGTTKKKKGNESGDDAGLGEGGNYEDDADLGDSNYDDAAEKEDTSETSMPDDKLKADQRANVVFHLCMAFASVYMAMLYTNWGTNTTNEELSSGRSYESMWVNIIAQWITFVLYMWTNVAKKACPGRFGYGGEDE